MYKRILFATDGSRTSDHALQEVLKLSAYGSEVRVLTVVENPLETFPATYVYLKDSEQYMGRLVEEGQAILDRAKALLVEHEVHADTQLVQLAPGNHDIPAAILAQAETWAADIIVLGKHGRKGIRRLVMGSVAEQLVRECHYPVLLVHGPEAS
jgi:nucleotide-binding universal stress UspA family protein